jgi:hypothetical protein
MGALADRTDYTLRDPAALGALLIYDWRLRGVFTDDELLAGLDQPITTSVLRNLQRIGLIRALHGVRPQGGRMRLWTVSDALKVQAVLTLRRTTGARLPACADALQAHAAVLAPVFERWREAGAAPPGGRRACLAPAGPELLSEPIRLKQAVNGWVEDYVARNRFSEARAPAFLI